MGGGFAAPGGRVVYNGTGGGLFMGILVGVLLPIFVAYALLFGSVMVGQQVRGDAGQAISALGSLVGGLALLVVMLIAANKMIGLYWDNVVIEGKRCQYRGTVGGLVGALIVPYILTGITFGIYFPWLYAKMKEFVFANVDVGGERLVFNGNPSDLLGKFLIMLAIVIFGSIVVVGPILGGAWFANELSAWEWNSTTISGRPFRYQATLGEVLVNQILVGLLAGCTMYIGLPWAMVMRWDFEAKHIA